MEENESELQTAYREVWEETGLAKEDLVIDSDFRYTETYYPFYKRFNGTVEKTLVMFLGILKEDSTMQKIKTTEHADFVWKKWETTTDSSGKTTVVPIQSTAVDSLMQFTLSYFEKQK